MEEQKRILKLVENGKLTAEEAILLLEKLEKPNKVREETILSELSTQVRSEQSKQEERHKSAKQYSVASKFIDFIDGTLKKIKDLDLDFNFGSAIEIQHIFQHSDVFINQVELDVANGSVKVIPWNDKDVRVECDAKVYKIENHDHAKEAFLKDVLFSIENGKLSFYVQKKHMKVHAKVYVPQENYEYMKIRMFNGPISSDGLQVKDFKAKTANGGIKLKNLQSQDIELEAANGHIHVCNTDCKDVEAETINGSIKLSGRFDKVDLQSFNGNVVCTLEDNKCHTAHVKTTTGSIDFYLPEDTSIDGDLRSNLGSLKCEFPNLNVIEEKNEVVQKSLRFKALHGDSKPMNLFAETKTGSIQIKTNGGK